MTQRQHTRALEMELKRINEVIDYKIVRGLEYDREARHHHALIRELKKKEVTWGFIKALSYINLF